MNEKKKPTKMAQVMFEKNISTLEVGNALGVSHSTISLIKNGWREPSAEQAAKIEEYLGETNLFAQIKN
jgi:transcriptional regulator with XRE-family HTH domain